MRTIASLIFPGYSEVPGTCGCRCVLAWFTWIPFCPPFCYHLYLGSSCFFHLCSLNSRCLQVWAILLTTEFYTDMSRCNIWVEMLNSLETGGGLECREESLCVEQDPSLQFIYARIYLTCLCDQLFCHVRLCSSMDCRLQGFPAYGIFQAKILEWIAMPFSRKSFWSREWTHIFYVSCIGRQILYHSHHLGSPICLLNEHLLSTYYVSDTVSNDRKTAKNNKQNPCP